MDAIILAGGMGTRLRSVLADRPKVLAEVAGKPFLHHVLTYLEGFRDVRKLWLSTGYKAEMVSRSLAGFACRIPVDCIEEEEPLGTGGALLHSLPRVEGPEVLLMNGDTFFPVPIDVLLERHRLSGAVLSLALTQVPDLSRYGAVDVAPTGRVTAFGEKNRIGCGLINGGVYLLDRAAFLARFGDQGGCSLERDLIPELIEGGRVRAWSFESPFIDIGVPEDLLRATRFFQDSCGPEA